MWPQYIHTYILHIYTTTGNAYATGAFGNPLANALRYSPSASHCGPSLHILLTYTPPRLLLRYATALHATGAFRTLLSSREKEEATVRVSPRRPAAQYTYIPFIYPCTLNGRVQLCYAKGAFRTRRANGVQSECHLLWPKYTVALWPQHTYTPSVYSFYTLCI